MSYSLQEQLLLFNIFSHGYSLQQRWEQMMNFRLRLLEASCERLTVSLAIKSELQASEDEEHLQEPEVMDRTWTGQPDMRTFSRTDRWNSPNGNNKHHFYDPLTVSAEDIMDNINILVKVGGSLLESSIKLNHQAWMWPICAGSRPKITKTGKPILWFTLQCGSQALSKPEFIQSVTESMAELW